MKSENQRLKYALNHVTTNYNALQMHLFVMMENQKADQSSPDGGGIPRGSVAPRQFMDLGLASIDAEAPNNEPSLSSNSDERKPGLTETGNNGTAKTNAPREDSVDDHHHSKIQRTTSSCSAKDNNNNDQTEATMRKARVSVRARSEAPMVYSLNLIS